MPSHTPRCNVPADTVPVELHRPMASDLDFVSDTDIHNFYIKYLKTHTIKGKKTNLLEDNDCRFQFAHIQCQLAKFVHRKHVSIVELISAKQMIQCFSVIILLQIDETKIFVAIIFDKEELVVFIFRSYLWREK